MMTGDDATAIPGDECLRPQPKMQQQPQALVNLAISGDSALASSDGVASIPGDDAVLAASIPTATPGGADGVDP